MQLIKAGKPMTFAQVWPSSSTGEWVIRKGRLGRAGTIEESGLDAESTDIAVVVDPLKEAGYVEVEDYPVVVVVQFPIESLEAGLNMYEHANPRLEQTLDERGLGFVDGQDLGKRGGSDRLVLNIYLFVLDAELGCQAAMAALRNGRVSPQLATIGYRVAESEEDWTLRYNRKNLKIPGAFDL